MFGEFVGTTMFLFLGLGGVKTAIAAHASSGGVGVTVSWPQQPPYRL